MFHFPQHIMDKYGPDSPFNIARFYGYPVSQMTREEMGAMMNFLYDEWQQTQRELAQERHQRWLDDMAANARNHTSFWGSLRRLVCP